MHAGLLIRDMRPEIEGYWFSVPNIGAFVEACIKGRKEVALIFKRQKHQELLQEVSYGTLINIGNNRLTQSSTSEHQTEASSFFITGAVVSCPRSDWTGCARKVFPFSFMSPILSGLSLVSFCSHMRTHSISTTAGLLLRLVK